ncbi:hypothetical protein DXA95_12230 [Odoribacter sp. OF09-27XD]|nr:hypothetical protein [Odoribacter sp. OF09-27XD]RHV92566.1 hypothetical protein DXA95_12230 [Odoribacter sp. OF09-27XD]
MEKIFEKMVEIVSEYTGATKNEILTGKTEELVNYRAILLSFLHDLGFSDVAISKYVNLTRQGVNNFVILFRIAKNIILFCQLLVNRLATT